MAKGKMPAFIKEKIDKKAEKAEEKAPAGKATPPKKKKC